MTGKIHNDGEFGPVVLRKNVRSRGISIRVRGSANRDGCRISVTLPWSLRYQDGLNYLEKETFVGQERVDSPGQEDRGGCG